MKISEIARLLDADIISAPDQNHEITGGYCGDFLSNVMSKAPENCAWFTVMSNVNVAAVASLAEIGVIILCENVSPDEVLKERVVSQKIPMLKTKLPIYEAVKKIG